jgi:uncharacterized membrane protein
MPKKNTTNDIDEDEWDNCPICSRSVKAKNLDRHLSKMHADVTNKELKERRKLQETRRGASGMKKSDLRKEMEEERKRKNMVLAIAGLFIFIIAIIGGYYLSTTFSTGNNNEEDINPEPAKEINDNTNKEEVRIPVSEVNDGDAHYYSYDSNGVKIRYFVLKSSDGVIRAAFDTCDVCYKEKKGYRQDGDDMVCNNCGQRFASVKINEEKGGCNPAPLDRTVVGNDLVIKTSDIESGRWYFE